MTDVVAVLVVRAEGDPGWLLAPGRLGAQAPTVHLTGHGWCTCEGGRGLGLPEALPLWWDGALVPEGWDRARRVFVAYLDARGKPSDGEPWSVLSPGRRALEFAAERLVIADLASRVVRLARVDGRLVEVS